ncbi:phospholipase D-like domain-containing protein [Paracoccus sp. P2]|uniref:phospholipase D-like domain-containing protein n=1 Tax=Paracoccus sp. P2 TaxID=3248840 RepID=UPI00391F2AFA
MQAAAASPAMIADGAQVRSSAARFYDETPRLSEMLAAARDEGEFDRPTASMAVATGQFLSLLRGSNRMELLNGLRNPLSVRERSAHIRASVALFLDGYRRNLLQAGVKLYELKLRGAQSGKQIFPMGISGASLHAKTFAVDHRRVFIGSFNFDRHSVDLNCEMGFLIDSPKMAAQVSTAFDNTIPLVSYQPALTPEANMVWVETLPEGRTEIYQQEPGATWLQQIAIAVIGILPVEWLL